MAWVGTYYDILEFKKMSIEFHPCCCAAAACETTAVCGGNSTRGRLATWQPVSAYSAILFLGRQISQGFLFKYLSLSFGRLVDDVRSLVGYVVVVADMSL